jgi:flagellar basal-body rod modification protein FlgD
MTTINPAVTTAPGVGAAATAARDDTTEAQTNLTADFNTFLTLLTAQMTNQDPLNPAEGTEFVAQLAQFSSVEQQIASNTKLTSILEAVSATGAGSLADWLGIEVRAEVPATTDGGPVDTFPQASTIAASNAVLVVRDTNGDVVAEQPFTPGDGAVTWNGQLASGADAPPGTYAFSARYASETGETEVMPAAVYTAVREARRDGDDTLLTLNGGATIATDEVSGVRRPT